MQNSITLNAEKISHLAGPKTASFVQLIFAIRSFIVSFTEFISVVDKFEKSQGGIIMKYSHKWYISFHIKSDKSKLHNYLVRIKACS